MHFYRIHDCQAQPEDPLATWAATLGDAHAVAKSRWTQPGGRSLARIDLYDLDVSKGGVLALLIGGFDGVAGKSILQRTWGLTARGGLVETTPGD